MSRSASLLPAFYLLVNLCTLVLSFYSSAEILNQFEHRGARLTILIDAILLWLLSAYITKIYRKNLHNGLMPRLMNYGKTYILFFAIIMISSLYLSNSFELQVNQWLLGFALTFVVVDLIVNIIFISLISKLRRRRENIKRTLVAGAGEIAEKVSTYLNSNPDYGYEIQGYLKCGGEECRVNQKKVVGAVSDIKDYLSHNEVDEVVIALPYESSRQKVQNIIHEADYVGARISYVPDFAGLLGTPFKLVHNDEHESWDTVQVRQLPLDEIYPALEKALFDLIFAFFTLVFLAPAFAIIAVLIKLDSPGSVFYCPVRIGRGGKNFTVYKFRTMSQNDATVGGTLSTQKDDPRITRIGKFLRKYNLDELPQFINVLLGDMSVVGPRPHRNFLNQQMKEHVDKYMIRHYFRPGVTGWAQVNGWRGPTETEEQIQQRTAHDLWYIENWSFSLDLKIIWMTIFSRKARQNAF